MARFTDRAGPRRIPHSLARCVTLQFTFGEERASESAMRPLACQDVCALNK